MWKFLKLKNNNKDFQAITKKQLEKNREVLESLRKYDEGKKEISTVNVKRRLQHIQDSL